MAERVEVRVAVVIDAEGTWNATGWSSCPSDEEAFGIAVESVAPGERRYILTAWIEKPDTQVTDVYAMVTPADDAGHADA